MDEIRPRIHRFGQFEIDFEQRLLLRAGDSVPLAPKAFATLATLIERQGRIVDKDELLRLVWPDTFVEENNLTQNISILRKVLGEGEYIETIPRRGYRFLMALDDDVSASAVAETGLKPKPQPLSSAIPKRTSHSLRMWIGSALGIAAVAILAFYISSRIRDYAPRRVDSLVVLPFVNLTVSPENEYFSDGLTEELTNSLAHLEGLRVVARTTAFQFKGKARDIRSIAKQLNVQAVVEGSVRRDGKKMRVTVQLNDARSGFHIWSQTYDNDEGDILKVQEDIANQVARRIRPDRHSNLADAGSRDLEAYNAYLLGRFNRRKPDSDSEKKAIGLFQQAIQKDPRYAAAYAGLAECYIALAQENSMNPLEAWALAQEAADKALALDPNLAEAHTTQAIVHLLMEWDWQAAEREFRQAIILNTNDAAAHHWFSHYFLATGRLDESLAESRRALELDPLDVQISGHLSFHYLNARDYPSAIQAGQRTLELDSHAQLAFIFMTRAYENSARWDKAIDTSELARAIHPETTVLRAAVNADGAQGYWRTRLAFLSKQTNPENYLLAIYHARLHEPDQAMERLELAFQMHEPDLIYLRREPAFDSMQREPRFKALAAALKLP